MNTILKLGPNSVVSQPGDPLLSPNGNVSVSANNDGTASLTRPVTGGGTETRRLVIAPPYDAEIEYLETTGTQYINTGIVPTPTLSLDCSGYFPNGSPGMRFGSRASANSECFYAVGVISNSANLVRYSFGASGTGEELQRYSAAKPHRRFVLNAATKSVFIEYSDGASEVLSFSQSAFTGSFPLFLLAFNNAGTASSSVSGTRLSACRIFDGSTLVRDFQPVRVGSGSSAAGYLYDRVSGELFGNAGTGDPFVLGPDVNVHTALVRADANFTNLRDWLTSDTFTFKPTITFHSGWSASLAIEFRIVNGRMAHVTGNIKCTSALTAGTSYTPFSAFSFPTGVNYYAGCRLGANQRVWIYFNGTSTTIIPEVNIDANTNIYLRGLLPMTLTPDTATSYVKYIASLF